MKSIVQKEGFNCEGVPFIPFLLTRKTDVPTRREFDTSLRNPKLPVTLDDLVQFLENRFIIMSAGWEGMSGPSRAPNSEKSVLNNPTLVAKTNEVRKK